MPNTQQYEAFDPKTGQYWDYDGKSWNMRAPQQSTVSKVWGAANKPLVSSESIAKIDPTQGLYDKWTDKAIAYGDPTLARISSFLSGSNKDATKLVSSFTSPVSLALAAASGGESALGESFPAIRAALKALQTTAGAGFGAQGAWDALGKKKAGESIPDEIERRLQGMSQAILGTTGAYSGIEAPRKVATRSAFGIGKMSSDIAKEEADKASTAEKGAYSQKVSEAKAKFDTEQARKQADYQAKKDALTAKNQATAEAQRKGYGESVAATDRAKVAASKLETTKRSLSDLKDRLSEQATSNIMQAEKAEKSSLDKRWGQFRDETKGVNVDWTPVQEAVSNAEENILKGSPENIALFRNIMKEGGGLGGLGDASVFKGGNGVDVKEFLSSIKDPVRRNQFIQEMRAKGQDVSPEQKGFAREGASIPFDQARGFYTELGRKLFGGDLPGDVWRAISSVQKAVDSQSEKSLEGLPKGPTGETPIAKYRGLKDDWSDYMRTWRDTRPLTQGGSPLSRIIQLTESPLAVKDKMSVYRDAGNQILQKSGDRTSYLLSRKKAFGADPSLPARLRSTDEQLRGLPQSAGKIPEVRKPSAKEAKDMPALASEQFKPPEASKDTPFNIEDWRREQLKHKAKYLGSRVSPWDIMFPPRLILERLTAKALNNPGILDWLTKDSQ